MFTDIVFPKNNEKKFIEIAEKLGIKSLCFVYNVKNKNDATKIKNKIKNIQKKTEIKLFTGIIDGISIKKLKKVTELTLVQASDKNQEIIEKTKPDIIFNTESSQRKDFVYSRNSGLNQVVCKSANKYGVIIGISMSNIINSKNKNVLLGRIKQNIKLCQKYKVKIVIASFAKEPYEIRSPHELRSLLAILGANTRYQKRALKNTCLKIEDNLRKKEPSYVTKEVSIVK